MKVRNRDLRSSAETLGQSRAYEAVEAGWGLWKEQLPIDEAVLFDWLLRQELERRLRKHSISNVTISHSSLSALQAPVPINVYFASEVLHALFDNQLLFNDAFRLSSTGSSFVIRQPSHSQLQQIPWLNFFEGALDLNTLRTPDTPVLQRQLAMAGFKCTSTIEISESQYLSPKRFIRPLETRAFSILRLLPESSYAAGLHAAKMYAQTQTRVENISNMTCLTGWR